MVRLKVDLLVIVQLARLFQFQSGAVKSVRGVNKGLYRAVFQFQSGAVKRTCLMPKK